MKLQELRMLYEPYINSLAAYFRVAVPPWIAAEHSMDNWQASTWDKSGSSRGGDEKRQREHF